MMVCVCACVVCFFRGVGKGGYILDISSLEKYLFTFLAQF